MGRKQVNKIYDLSTKMMYGCVWTVGYPLIMPNDDEPWDFRRPLFSDKTIIPRNSNSQKKLGVCENWVFTCRFRCFRRFSQKLVVFWGLHSLAYTDQLEVTQRLYGRFLPLIMVFCEQILGLWGKTEPCRDLLFHTSMAKEVGMWPSEFTQHE